MRTRAYWKEFQREAIEKGLARELPYEVIEVIKPIQIVVRWSEKGQERFGLAEYLPGEILYRERRRAIVDKIKDLYAAIRQRGRHIPARLIARKREAFTLVGDAQILAGYGRRLARLLEDLLRREEQASRPKGEVSPELSQLALELARARTSFKRRAREEVLLAQKGEYWQTSVRVSQAVTYLLQERARDFEMAAQSIRLAEKWLHLMGDIERRFRNCYRRLGQLGEELQNNPLALLSIAREAYGIWTHLEEEIPNFNPYYERLQSAEWQRLSRVVTHARERGTKTVYNDIEAAVAKLEAIAIGIQPTRAELARSRKELF